MNRQISYKKNREELVNMNDDQLVNQQRVQMAFIRQIIKKAVR
jgi:hypothetical protein